MKKTVVTLGILLIAFATAAAASPMSASLAYQEGLFFQRTVGDLEKALKLYDRAMKEAADAEDGDLLESILLRRAECFDLLGRENEQQITIASLREETRAANTRLGYARFFPPESDIIVQVDLAALLSSPLVERLDIKTEIKSEEIDKVVQLLGINPLKDLHKVTMGLTLSENEKMPAEHWLVHFEGNLSALDTERLSKSGEQLAPGKSPPTRKIHDVDVLGFDLPVPEEKGKVMTVGVAPLGQEGILAGDIKSVESALAARAGKAAGLSANTQLANLAAQVPPDSTFWLAGLPNQIVKKLQKMGQIELPGLPQNLPELSGLMLSGRVTKDLEAVGMAFTEDLQSARLLGDIFRGMLALAQLVPLEEEPLVKKLVESLRVETGEREVKVYATLPGDLIAEEGSLPKEARLKATGEGRLSINTNPWSVVFIDGKKMGNSPLTRIKLKAGAHDVKLVNEAAGISEKLRIVIEAGKETRVVKQLKAN